jgi:hypothetical protein
VAQREEVPAELGDAAAVVDVDERHAVDVRALHRDDRNPAGLQRGERGIVLQPAGGEDRGVQRHAQDLLQRRPSRVAREQQQARPVCAQHLGDAVQQLHRDRVAERVEQPLADEHPDHAAAAAAQRSGDRVRTRVPELGRGGEHALAGGGGDARAAGERQRRRGRGDPGARGDARERGSCGHSPTVAG